MSGVPELVDLRELAAISPDRYRTDCEEIIKDYSVESDHRFWSSVFLRDGGLLPVQYASASSPFQNSFLESSVLAERLADGWFYELSHYADDEDSAAVERLMAPVDDKAQYTLRRG